MPANLSLPTLTVVSLVSDPKPIRKRGRASPVESSRPKTLTRQARSAQLGVNLIERIATEMRAKWTPMTSNDVGIDGYIEFFDPTSGHSLGLTVAVQAKAWDAQRRLPAETSSSFAWTVRERDLAYWLGNNLPVFIIVARPPNEAYWIPVRQAFADPAVRKARRVAVDKVGQRFSAEALPAIVGLVAPPAKRALITIARPEQLVANLLPVELPAQVMVADALVPDARDISADLRAAGSGDRSWILHERRVLTFHDLRAGTWPTIVDPGTVEEFDSAEWAASTDPDRARLFTWLLNSALRQQIGREVAFRKSGRVYYFRGGGRALTGTERLDWKIADPATGRKHTVFSSWWAKAGHRIAYKHLAAELAFQRVDDTWHLAINPTYVYTSNGWNPSCFESAGVTGMKELQRNDAVWRDVRFWANFLRRQPDFDEVHFLGFGSPPTFDVDRGVDDEAWLSRGEAIGPDDGLWTQEGVA